LDPKDPDIDFGQIFSQYDTLLIGRRTFETMLKAGRASVPGMSVFAFSRTLRPGGHPNVAMVAEGAADTVAALRAKPGKDIWLFGGGSLFRALAEARLVDSVEVAVAPVLLGGGIPLLPPPSQRIKLVLQAQKVYKTGIVPLDYAAV
jgi:dihydrofolate reductase